MNSDLTRCAGTGCPRRNECLRARLAPVARFDHFTRTPWDALRGVCEHHVPLPVVDDEAVRTRAYHRWLAEGRPEGRADAHWHDARAELLAQRDQWLSPPFEESP